jgi:transposase
MNVFAVRAAELTVHRPELAAAIAPLLNARAAIEQQIADLDRKVMRLARNNAQARRFMTAPGVGQSRLFVSLQRSMILPASNDPEASEPILD